MQSVRATTVPNARYCFGSLCLHIRGRTLYLCIPSPRSFFLLPQTRGFERKKKGIEGEVSLCLCYWLYEASRSYGSYSNTKHILESTGYNPNSTTTPRRQYSPPPVAYPFLSRFSSTLEKKRKKKGTAKAAVKLARILRQRRGLCP